MTADRRPGDRESDESAPRRDAKRTDGGEPADTGSAAAPRTSDGGRSAWETVLWALVLLVPVAGLVWEFGLSFIEAKPLSSNLPILFIERLRAVADVFVIVMGGGTLLAFAYAAVRYSDAVRDRPEAMPVNWGQTLFLAFIAVVIGSLLISASFGAATLLSVDSGPAPPASVDNHYQTRGSLTYKVIGVQWTWMVKPVGPNFLGFAMRRTIRFPTNTTIHLQITSKDVIHSFAIQELGVKKDAVPGQLNHFYFVVDDPGEYQVNCAELCGAGHSQMTPTMIAMPRDEYARWVVDNGGTNPFESGPAANVTAENASESESANGAATATNATTAEAAVVASPGAATGHGPRAPTAASPNGGVSRAR